MVTEETNDQGRLTIELPVGDAVLWSMPDPDVTQPDVDRFAFERVIQVGEVNQSTTLRLRPYRRIRLHVQGLPARGSAMLATTTGQTEIELEAGRATLQVPAQPSAVHLLAYGQRHVVRTPDSVDGEWTVRWPQPPRYTLPIRDAAGQPVPARVAFWDRPGKLAGVAEDEDALRTSAGGEVLIPPEHCYGTIFAIVVPDSRALVPILHRIDVPLLQQAKAGAARTLDPIVVPARATPPLQLQGTDFESWTAHLMRPGLYFEHATGSDGVWSGPVPQTGDWVVLDPPAAPPGRAALRVRQQLTGAGPWSVQIPEGTLQLAFETPQGESLAGVHVYLGDQHWLSDQADLRIDHVPDGPLQLTCGHPEHGACRVKLPAKPTRTTKPTGWGRVVVRLPGR